MTIEVSSAVIDRMLAEAVRTHPEECCGILLGEGGAIRALRPTKNVHPDPQRNFEIDPQELIEAHRRVREGGAPVLGYYHSHPNGLAEPSAADCALAARDGSIWAVIAAGRVAFFRSGDAGFAPLPYVLGPR